MFLGSREPGLIEEMDRENCDQNKLNNTYTQFHYINKLLSKWRSLYKTEIRPLLAEQHEPTLLDIGFGGGDITRSIEIWAQNDGFDLKITAIDPDDRAFNFCKHKYSDSNIEWLQCTSSDLVAKNLEYDIVISNHLLHHLSDKEILKLLIECEKLSKRKVVFNDIERNTVGYFLFSIFSRILFHNSFITADGLTSIRRSFKRSELESLIPSSWTLRKTFPFRLFLIHEK